MDRALFQERLQKRTLLSDGPLGRILGASRGTESSASGLPEMLGIEDADRLKALHLESLKAGADLILTNTFATNRTTLAPLGAADRLPSMVEASMQAVRDACLAHPASGADPALIGFVLGPLAASVLPHGTLPFGLALDSYREVVGLALKERPDIFVLEAMRDLQMVKTALMAIRELAPDTPVAVQMAFEPLGRTSVGTSPAAFLAVSRSLGADLVGASGQMNPVEMMPIVKMLGRLTDIPLIFQPHAIKSGAARSGKIRPNEFSSQMKALLEHPMGVIGCSGSPGPHYPAHLHRLLRRHRPAYPERRPRLLLASESRDVEISTSRGLAMIKGWRSGHARPGALTSRSWDVSIQAAEIQAPARRGEEAKFLRETIPLLQSATGRPLLIQTDSPKGMEAALEVTLGRPLLWGAWLSKTSLERVVPLAKRYGAAVVAVTMSEKLPPRTIEDRVTCGDELIEELISRGLSQEDIVIDPDVTEVTSKATDALIPLGAAAQLKERWGQPVLIRLGRLTRGQEVGRAGIEAAFLAMAAAAGADLFVGDFDFPPLRQAALAASYLSGRDPGGRRYRANVPEQTGPPPRRESGPPPERRYGDSRPREPRRDDSRYRPPRRDDARPPASRRDDSQSRPPRRDDSRSRPPRRDDSRSRPPRRDDSRPSAPRRRESGPPPDRRRPSGKPRQGRPPSGSKRPKPGRRD